MCIIGYEVCSTLGSQLEVSESEKSGGAAAELGLSKAKGIKWFLWQEATTHYLLLVYVPRRCLYVINLGYIMVFHIIKQQQPL